MNNPRHFTILFFLISIAASTHAAEVHAYPYKNARVGDWVEYKMSGGTTRGNVELKQKRSVTEKTETTITMETVMSVMGHEMKHSQTVNLDQKFDPSSFSQQRPGQPATKPEYKEVGTGEETLNVGGKSLACTWFSYEVTSEGKTSKAKVWRCNDVPLGGMVKMESETARGSMTMELTDFGNGK